MRIATMVVGLVGALVGFVISFLGFISEVIFVFGNLGGITFVLIEIVLVLFL